MAREHDVELEIFLPMTGGNIPSRALSIGILQSVSDMVDAMPENFEMVLTTDTVDFRGRPTKRPQLEFWLPGAVVPVCWMSPAHRYDYTLFETHVRERISSVFPENFVDDTDNKE